MADEKPQGTPSGGTSSGGTPPQITKTRIIVWIVAAAVGFWLIGTGIAGIITKG